MRAIRLNLNDLLFLVMLEFMNGKNSKKKINEIKLRYNLTDEDIKKIEQRQFELRAIC